MASTGSWDTSPSHLSTAAAKAGYSERSVTGNQKNTNLDKRANAAVIAARAAVDSCQYLGIFGLDATDNNTWSPRHLERVQANSQPMLEVAVRGHDEADGHTWYVLECAIWRPFVEFGRAEWSCRRRLVHLREGLHDSIKEWLGLDGYGKHFGDVPFASHGGLPGTTDRLRGWCQNLQRCINTAVVPPVVAATTLRLLDAPVKDPAVTALARSCRSELASTPESSPKSSCNHHESRTGTLPTKAAPASAAKDGGKDPSCLASSASSGARPHLCDFLPDDLTDTAQSAEGNSTATGTNTTAKEATSGALG